MSRRGDGRFSLFAEDDVEFGSLPSRRRRAAAASARASVDVDQLCGELRRHRVDDADAEADDELGDFVSASRLRFQQLLTGGAKVDDFRPSSADRFQCLMGSTSHGAEGAAAGPRGFVARGDGADAGGLLGGAGAALLAERPLLLTDRPSLLGDCNSPLSGRSRLTDRLVPAPPGVGSNGVVAVHSGAMINSSSSVMNSSSAVMNSSSAVRSASSSVVNSSSAVRSASSSAVNSSSAVVNSAASSRAVADGSGPPVGSEGAGALRQLPQVSSSRKQTFQQSRTASNTTFSQSMDGGPAQSNTTRRSEQQRTCATTENGATSVAQQRAQKLETATLTSHNGETRVAAERAEVQQAMAARSRGDGVTDVQERVRTAGAVRDATFRETDSGAVEQVAVSGEDFSAGAQLDYVHESGGGGAPFQINSGGVGGDGGGRRQPLWRFSAFGPLIQPPSGKIRGQVAMQTSHSMFNCQPGALPSFSSSQFSYEDTFEVSETESDDDDLYLPAPVRRAGRLGLQMRPALPAPSDPASPDTPSVAPSEAPSEAAAEREADISEDVAQAEEEERRRLERLSKIAAELTMTERKYVQELHLIDQIFHFRVDQENRAHHMFNNEITTQMFSNIKSIYQFHKDHMLPQLEARLAAWDSDPRIGDVMKNCAPFLKMYTEFVKNFDNAMNLINAFAAKCSRFATIMNEIHEMDECGNLPLQHHMIVPIQRVPRYELLLKDYLKRLTEDSPDYEDTKKALELVTHAATHSNDTMKRVDKFKQLLEIQENISGGPDLVSPTRELIKEGKISKISARSGDHQERYLFLFSDLLLLCSPRLINNRIISGPAYRLRAKFSIEGMQVLEGDNLETVNTFYVNGNQKKVELYTQTPAEKIEWLETLCRVVTSFYERRASLKSDPHGLEELGRKAPVMLRQDGVSRCMDCESQFGMMRRKHGCHACGIVACSKCSSRKVPLPCEQNKPARVCNRCYHLLTERANQGDTSAASQRRESVLDVSYTRGKGVLDVPATGESLLSGYLQLRSRKSWSRRWFCLRADCVLYSYQSEEAERALTAMPVPGFTVSWGGATAKAEPGVADKDRDRSLKLFHAKKTYVLLAESRDDVARWVSVLQKAARAEALLQSQKAV